METFATAALLVFVIVAYENYAKGNLGDWVKSKFFNAAEPASAGIFAGIGQLLHNATTTTVGNSPSSGGAIGNLGKLVRPVPGAITSSFGEARSGHSHAGVDFAASEGDSISAATSGTVSATGSGGDCGNRVDIDAGDGRLTRYCHLSRLAVTQGQHVTAGQTIGNVGHTGDATGPHLHFELHINGTAVDPAPYL